MQSSTENIYIVETSLSDIEIRRHYSEQHQKRLLMERFITTLQSLCPQISVTNFYPLIYQFDFGFANIITNYRFRFKVFNSDSKTVHIILLRKSEQNLSSQRFLRSTQFVFDNYCHVIQLPTIEYETCKTTLTRFTLKEDLSNMENLCQLTLNFMIKDKIL